MSSFPGQGFALVAENTTGESIQPGAPPNKSARTKLRLRNEEPPLPTVEIEQLLELGMALGHKRFEIASLAGRDADGIVAAHAWAEARGGEAELVPSKRQTKTNALGSPSYYDRPAFGLDGREERRREVSGQRMLGQIASFFRGLTAFCLREPEIRPQTICTAVLNTSSCAAEAK